MGARHNRILQSIFQFAFAKRHACVRRINGKFIHVAHVVSAHSILVRTFMQRLQCGSSWDPSDVCIKLSVCCFLAWPGNAGLRRASTGGIAQEIQQASTAATNPPLTDITTSSCPSANVVEVSGCWCVVPVRTGGQLPPPCVRSVWLQWMAPTNIYIHATLARPRPTHRSLQSRSQQRSCIRANNLC